MANADSTPAQLSNLSVAKKTKLIARAEFMASGLKRCPTCNMCKPFEEFGVWKKHWTGRFSYCLVCQRARLREHRLSDIEKSRSLERIRAARARQRPSTESAREWRRARERRLRADPVANLCLRVRKSIWQSLKRSGLVKSARSFTLLDYTPAELARHIERQFVSGMSWENMGEWHIDHIVPLSSFNITSQDCPEFKRAWEITNLRPLWAKDNLRKNKTILFLL